MLTGSDYNTVWLWDTETAEQPRTFGGHTRSVYSLAFSPNGRLIATASGDGTVRIWSNPVGPAPTTQAVAPQAESVERRTGVPRPNALVLVIGNKNYAHAPEVRFADRDAKAMADWFRDVLGVLPENVLEEHDASSVRMAQLFGTSAVPKGEIHNRARFADEVIVYYSGHGVPFVPEQGRPLGHLLPVDVPAAEPRFGGYPLDLLIAQLQLLPVNQVTVLLDACFSGLTQGEGGAVPMTSAGFAVGVAAPVHEAKVSVLSATAFEQPQFAHWLVDRQHGAFTWYALEGLGGAADRDGDDRIGFRELGTYIDERLAKSGLQQTPSFTRSSGDPLIVELARP
ncbi:caspase family protein [Fertoebacter nigrum]|uniref:Caspase family protein n=1 Tax=Fertoeibacter niger TaxID=2656921 RepID=A0A8X8KSP1_9RHOB|nr:caspase family protein [Fertoeibacter niger]